MNKDHWWKDSDKKHQSTLFLPRTTCRVFSTHSNRRWWKQCLFFLFWV